MDRIYDEVRRSAPSDRGIPVAAIPAVAGILWRPASDAPSGIEVYLARRAPSHRFLGGFWAFPGGRIDPIDGGDSVRACVRELAEELAITVDPQRIELRRVARFVTPEFAPMRFDADYYLIGPMGDSRPNPGASPELVEGHWVSPTHALERNRSGEWLMPSTVIVTLEKLAGGIDDTLEERLARASDRDFAARMWPLCPGIAIAPVRTPTLPPATHTNTYVIGTGELVIIDPASPYDDERAGLDAAIDDLVSRGARLRAILLTHHHGDHIGGAAHLAKRLAVPVWAHCRTAELLRGRVAVDRHIEPDQVIDLPGQPGRRLRALFTPGHAPGHLCFVEETTGWIVAGDMVASGSTILIDPSEGSMADYLDSLDRMAGAAPRALLPAHGPPIPDAGHTLAEYRRHRLWREQRVLDALAEVGPATARTLVPRAYADVSPALHGLAERSLISHLIKLADDGRARQDGEIWSPI